MRQQFHGAAKNASIPAGFRPHSLRHAFASTLLSRGVPITDVARWMGHKDIRETYNTYSHFMPEAEDRGLPFLMPSTQNGASHYALNRSRYDRYSGAYVKQRPRFEIPRTLLRLKVQL